MRAAIEDLRWRWRRGWRSAVTDLRERMADRRAGSRGARHVGIALLVALIAVEAGIAGYQIGSSGGIEGAEADQVQREAYRSAFEPAHAEAAAGARQEGALAGRRAGRHAGARAGTRAGQRRGSAAADRKAEAIARQQALAAAQAEAAAARQARRENQAAPVTPTPTVTTPTPTPTPTPAPTPATPEPPCFDAAGHPC